MATHDTWTDAPAQTRAASRHNSRAALSIEETPEVLGKIRDAFAIFDNQSALLQASFDNLRRNLARTNQELNEKNKALSVKVEEISQVSSRLQCILESLGDGVLVVNSDLLIERCNPAAEALLDSSRSHIEGRPYAEVMNGLGNLDALRTSMAGGRALLDEQRSCTSHHGETITVLASVSPIFSQTGAILGAVEVLRDVTQIRALEERVQHQKRMAALGEMATSVAHEIRNPLGAIEGFARLLKQDLVRDGHEDHMRMTSKIIEGAQNLNYVITNLLTYARPMTIQYEPFDAGVLLASVQELLLGIAGQRQVKLDVADGSGVGKVSGDIRQLRQVLVNLGRNALEACAKGGTVQIRVSERDRFTVFDVVDNGSGIARDDLPRIFDPFFTRKSGGTGLGLALCHKIVAAHSGEITVSSVAGKGATFSVVVPRMGEKK